MGSAFGFYMAGFKDENDEGERALKQMQGGLEAQRLHEQLPHHRITSRASRGRRRRRCLSLRRRRVQLPHQPRPTPREVAGGGGGAQVRRKRLGRCRRRGRCPLGTRTAPSSATSLHRDTAHVSKAPRERGTATHWWRSAGSATPMPWPARSRSSPSAPKRSASLQGPYRWTYPAERSPGPHVP